MGECLIHKAPPQVKLKGYDVIIGASATDLGRTYLDFSCQTGDIIIVVGGSTTAKTCSGGIIMTQNTSYYYPKLCIARATTDTVRINTQNTVGGSDSWISYAQIRPKL